MNIKNYSTIIYGTGRDVVNSSIIYSFYSRDLDDAPLNKKELLPFWIDKNKEYLLISTKELEKSKENIQSVFYSDISGVDQNRIDTLIYVDSNNEATGYTVFSVPQELVTDELGHNRIHDLFFEISLEETAEDTEILSLDFISSNADISLSEKLKEGDTSCPWKYVTEIPSYSGQLKYVSELDRYNEDQSLSILTDTNLLSHTGKGINWINPKIDVTGFNIVKTSIYNGDPVVCMLNTTPGLDQYTYRFCSLTKTNIFKDPFIYFAGELKLEGVNLDDYSLDSLCGELLVFSYSKDIKEKIKLYIPLTNPENFFVRDLRKDIDTESHIYYDVLDPWSIDQKLITKIDTELFKKISLFNSRYKGNNYTFEGKTGKWYELRNINNPSTQYWVSGEKSVILESSVTGRWINEKLILIKWDKGYSMIAVDSPRFSSLDLTILQSNSNLFINRVMIQTSDMVRKGQSYSDLDLNTKLIIDGLRSRPLSSRPLFDIFDNIIDTLCGFIFYLEKENNNKYLKLF